MEVCVTGEAVSEETASLLSMPPDCGLRKTEPTTHKDFFKKDRFRGIVNIKPDHVSIEAPSAASSALGMLADRMRRAIPGEELSTLTTS